jgi:hypothetical protein
MMKDYIEQLRNMTKSDRADAIETRIAEDCSDLIESAEFERAANSTSAVGWDLDEVEVLDVALIGGQWVARFSFVATGSQVEDTCFAGDRIDGEAEAVIDRDGNVRYQDVSAEVSDKFSNTEEEGNTKPRYEYFWHNRYLTDNATSIEDMVAGLRSAADELEEMRLAGVRLEDLDGIADDWGHLTTDDPQVAERFGFEEPYDDDEEDLVTDDPQVAELFGFMEPDDDDEE